MYLQNRIEFYLNLMFLILEDFEVQIVKFKWFNCYFQIISLRKNLL